MNQGSRDLLDYALRQVTQQDIWDHCPSDPGYPGYVEAFTKILTSGVVPPDFNFDISETICLGYYSDASLVSNPTRFRRFRTLTNSVGIAISASETGPDELVPVNYLTISILDDALALHDVPLLELLPPALAEVHRRVIEAAWCLEEAPFLLLAQIMLICRGYNPDANLPHLVAQLRATPGFPRFLWEGFNQFRDRWMNNVGSSFPSKSEDKMVASLRKEILG